jgi:hypothetical protein
MIVENATMSESYLIESGTKLYFPKGLFGIGSDYQPTEKVVFAFIKPLEVEPV